jgi:protein-tyrosine phosphatase
MNLDAASAAGPESSVAPANRLANFRDIGGMSVGDRGTVAGGVLYRSDAPYRGDLPPLTAPVWPPAVVVDVRSAGETNNGYAWPETTVVHHRPLLAEAAPALQTGSLEALYQHILQAAPQTLAEIAAIVAEADGPVLVHCSAGKDRTGVTVALLLRAVGVGRDEILADYATTEPNVPRVLDRLQALGYDIPIHRALPPQLLLTPPDAMVALLDTLDAWDGGAAGWLRAHGLSEAGLAALRERLVVSA